jgi:membrane protease YdiL (CAAX protease family)
MSTLSIETRTRRGLNGLATAMAFGIPALLLILGVHVVMRWFNATFGTAPFYGYFVGVTAPLAGLLAAAVWGARREGADSWPALKTRLRLRPMDRSAWLWTLLTVVGTFLLTGALTPLNGILLKSGLIPVPAWLPAFLAPLTAQAEGGAGGAFAVYDAAFGGLEGKWHILFLYLLLFFFNIAGEELWWRGYLLPRQEATLGRRAWLIHGLLWWGFHAFKWWDLLPLLPATLLISYVAQRTQNTTPGLISHGVINGIAMVPMVLGILGLL